MEERWHWYILRLFSTDQTDDLGVTHATVVDDYTMKVSDQTKNVPFIVNLMHHEGQESYHDEWYIDNAKMEGRLIVGPFLSEKEAESQMYSLLPNTSNEVLTEV